MRTLALRLYVKHKRKEFTKKAKLRTRFKTAMKIKIDYTMKLRIESQKDHSSLNAENPDDHELQKIKK